MYPVSLAKTPDPKEIPHWMHDYESPGGPTNPPLEKANLIGSKGQPTEELTKRKAGRY